VETDEAGRAVGLIRGKKAKEDAMLNDHRAKGEKGKGKGRERSTTKSWKGPSNSKNPPVVREGFPRGIISLGTTGKKKETKKIQEGRKEATVLFPEESRGGRR